jgi:hypothetical protein
MKSSPPRWKDAITVLLIMLAVTILNPIYHNGVYGLWVVVLGAVLVGFCSAYLLRRLAVGIESVLGQMTTRQTRIVRRIVIALAAQAIVIAWWYTNPDLDGWSKLILMLLFAIEAAYCFCLYKVRGW